MTACMAPDIRFYSPVAFKPFSGRESVRGLFDALFQVFEDFRYVDELTQGEIGEQIGVSQMQVSRILRGTVERLRYDLLADDERRTQESAA